MYICIYIYIFNVLFKIYGEKKDNVFKITNISLQITQKHNKSINLN